MSRINPSKDHVTKLKNVLTDTAGAPTTADKYDNTRHLKYGQTESSKKEGTPEAIDQKKEESLLNPPPVRRYSASSDSRPTLQHTFHEEFMGGLSGDDVIIHEEKKERDPSETSITTSADSANKTVAQGYVAAPSAGGLRLLFRQLWIMLKRNFILQTDRSLVLQSG
ncbi:3954_t:CDS:2 [Acaulospora colombiana]|uniref:3954_t:CDS:1 n=1 Tax=Acaulospora colombiana TaxID=27376 RepID=A0ACA9M6T8_9GLOM|nr:3954_t:CDS:2 [Acaulospora colombiana]